MNRVLVTGATGYIGGRLVPRLLDEGWDVRCMTRNAARLRSVAWSDRVEIVEADLLDESSLEGAFDGCERAFYLVHSMETPGEDFADRDRRAATNFAGAAARAGVGKLIYLGGLGKGDLSDHLKSRQEVGRILADSGVPTIELRAAVIIGSGSVSFEMLRYLTEVLPAMVTPQWVRTKCQPIAAADVLEILSAAATDDAEGIVEIGGPDVMTYEAMMRVYAEVAGLPRRLIVPVPLLTPSLSSRWVGLVTPLPVGVARPLVDSLRNEVTVSDNSYAEKVAAPLIPYRSAVERALTRSLELDVSTRWSGATQTPAQALPSDPDWAGGSVKRDTQLVRTSAAPEDVFWSFTRIGGDVGYYTMNWAWGIRGVIDAILGGVGLRRGRRHPEQLREGEALDFWRVVDVVPGRKLQLNAEMKVPGDAWLTFEAEELDSGSLLTQEAVFVPRGLVGRLYWYAMYPFHILIFGRMARRIAAAAEERG